MLCLGLFEIWRFFLFRGYILVSKLLGQGVSSRKLQTTFRKFYGGHKPWGRVFPHGNFRLLSGNSMVVTNLVHKFDTSVSQMLKICSPTVTYDWYPVIVNRDGCQIWVRNCALLPEHLISLPLGSSWFHTFIIYASQNLSV